jgi:uncharacterized membrane protein YbhN (UPF0104 family)
MRRIETYIILVAVAFYVWFLRRFGWHQTGHYLWLAGWGLVLTIALESLARMANTLGWWVVIGRLPGGLSFGELFVARIAGEAIDYTTPSAQLGGQFVMALMVRRKLALAIGLATVIVASLAEMLGQIGFITGVLAIALPHEARLHHLVGAALSGLLISFVLAAGFFYVQLKRPFSHLWKAAAKFHVPYLDDPEIRAEAANADANISDLYAKHRGRFGLSSLCYLFAWCMGPIEIMIYLKLLNQPFNWLTPVLVDALGLLIERVTFIIPGKLVSQEGGKALILSLLGYPAAIGFAIGLLRRIKEMVWVLFGLIGLTIHRVITGRDPVAVGPAGRNLVKIREAHEGEIS